jgi:hypothetical protein
VKEKRYRDYLRGRRQGEDAVRSAVGYVREFERSLRARGKRLDTATVDDVKLYVSELMAGGLNTFERVVSLQRYLNLIGRSEEAVQLYFLLSATLIYGSISDRLALLNGEEARRRVFGRVQVPPVGAPTEAFPAVTRRLMESLAEELSPEKYRRVLAGNHHRVPAAAFDKHKEWLREAGSLDGFLKKVHDEAVAEITRYMEEGRMWYEQVITPEVVELVQGNQEILSAVRDGEWLYMTKIPFAPKDWLVERDPKVKRFLACHCPLARSAIASGEADLPLDWCYCSGGYEKWMFDVVFGAETEVEVLESAVAGSDRCRFRVRIPEGVPL